MYVLQNNAPEKSEEKEEEFEERSCGGTRGPVSFWHQYLHWKKHPLSG